MKLNEVNNDSKSPSKRRINYLIKLDKNLAML